jgi:hypothetical protein
MKAKGKNFVIHFILYSKKIKALNCIFTLYGEKAVSINFSLTRGAGKPVAPPAEQVIQLLIKVHDAPESYKRRQTQDQAVLEGGRPRFLR